MASSSSLLSFTLFFLIFHTPTTHATKMILTIFNNCPFTVWPAIQSNSGHDILQNGGFELPTLHHRSFYAPSHHWSGRIWARTHCYHSQTGNFSCLTGDCDGRLECNGAGGSTPVTLAQFTLHHGNNDLSSYAVSLVDGYNVPMTVTPHEGKGHCPVVGCMSDLLPICPTPLQMKCNGLIVGCKSGCEVFNSDELCCRNHYNNPKTCRPSNYSAFFKNACPATFTYAHDTPSLTHNCASPKELKIIFCH